jgi:hypothetical protein
MRKDIKFHFSHNHVYDVGVLLCALFPGGFHPFFEFLSGERHPRGFGKAGDAVIVGSEELPLQG